MTANISQASLNTTMGVPLLTKGVPASKPSDPNQQLLNIIQQLVSDLGSNGGHTPGQAADGAAAPGGTGGPSAAGGPGGLAQQSGAASANGAGGAGGAGGNAMTQQLTQAIGDLAKAIGQQPGSAAGTQDLTQTIAALAQALAQQPAGAAAANGPGMAGPGGAEGAGSAGTNSQLAQIIGELAQALQAQTAGGAGQAMGGAGQAMGGAGQAMGGLSNGETAGAGELGNAAGLGGITGSAMPSTDPVSAAAQQLAQAMQSQGETQQGMTSPVPVAIGQLAQALSAQTGANQGVTENQIVRGLASAMNPGMGDNGSGAMPPAVANAVQQVLANLEGQGAPAASSPAAMPSLGGAGGAGGMGAPSESGGLSGNGSPAGGASNPLMNVLNELVQMLEARMAMQTAGNNPLASAVADLSKALAA